MTTKDSAEAIAPAPTKRHFSGRDECDHAVDVKTPKAAREAIDAAETLGLELSEVEVRGHWKAHPDADGGPAHRSTWELRDTNGRKWFRLSEGVGTIRARPIPSDIKGRDSTLRLRFDATEGK